MQEEILNNVQELRRHKNITQQELAEKVGVTRQTVIAVEKGSYTPSLLLAMKIANVFNKKIEEIFKIK